MAIRTRMVIWAFLALPISTQSLYASSVQMPSCAERKSKIRILKGSSEKEVAAGVLKCYCQKTDEKLGTPVDSSPINPGEIKEIAGSDLDKVATAAIEQGLKSIVISTMPEHETSIHAWKIQTQGKTLTFIDTVVSTPEDKVPNYFCGFTLIIDEKVALLSKRVCEAQNMPYEQVGEDFQPFDVINDFIGRPAILAKHNSSVGATAGGDLVLFSRNKDGWAKIDNGCGWGD